MKSVFLSLIVAAAASAADSTALTLADFTNPDGKPAPAGWVAEADGVIHLVVGGGNIVSKNDYASFEVEWEWKVAPGGNNGLKYWVAPLGEKKEWLGIEYQMIDDWKHADGLKGGSHTTACIYDIKAAAADKPFTSATDWNRSKVVVKDGKIEHWLNGKMVVSADTKSEEWKALVAKSKFKSKPGFAPGKGRIMLTDHKDETWYRNLRVKEL